MQFARDSKHVEHEGFRKRYTETGQETGDKGVG